MTLLASRLLSRPALPAAGSALRWPVATLAARPHLGFIAQRPLTTPPGQTQGSTTAASSAPVSEEHLDVSWAEFFRLRQQRRLTERLTMVPTTLATLSLGGTYLLEKEIDPTNLIFGFDPMMIYGVAMVGCGLAGVLIGPVIGGALWKLTHRRHSRSMEHKDLEFYHHIAANRADPSQHSFRNPIPDFYGEKINSLSDYRKWLRKQKAHMQKAAFHVGEEA
ncbi:TIM23 complex component [Tieghemiomyces parasiticus]|uniref:Presequence translocated-associated motor subunit PAM17 n=1 Tax=Tieghemiomyces parasiticus TaxID=78921 RepID=A0A9W8E2T3_9FUNG|nr:TIM23 complex component [Tieghemiomyces parasiticus]